MIQVTFIHTQLETLGLVPFWSYGTKAINQNMPLNLPQTYSKESFRLLSPIKWPCESSTKNLQEAPKKPPESPQEALRKPPGSPQEAPRKPPGKYFLIDGDWAQIDYDIKNYLGFKTRCCFKILSSNHGLVVSWSLDKKWMQDFWFCVKIVATTYKSSTHANEATG